MCFSDAHEELRLHIRRFLESEVQPHLEEWEEKTFPDEIFRRFGELGFLGLQYPPEYGGEGGDYFSAVVLLGEMGRAGACGVGMGGAGRRRGGGGPALCLSGVTTKNRASAARPR